jgi:hypothetical protein
MLVMSGEEHSRARMIEGRAFRSVVPAYLGSEALLSVGEVASRLPDLPTVTAWSQSLAVLEAIVPPDPRFRRFSYRALPEYEQVAGWSDGCGDEYSITFTLDGVPQPLRAIAERVTYDESFGANATVTLWRLADDAAWSYGRLWAGMRQSSMQ